MGSLTIGFAFVTVFYIISAQDSGYVPSFLKNRYSKTGLTSGKVGGGISSGFTKTKTSGPFTKTKTVKNTKNVGSSPHYQSGGSSYLGGGGSYSVGSGGSYSSGNIGSHTGGTGGYFDGGSHTSQHIMGGGSYGSQQTVGGGSYGSKQIISGGSYGAHASGALHPAAINAVCDVNRPNEPHESDCHKFYQCTVGMSGGPERVEKTCGQDMYYNPALMICDWSYNVVKIKPECAGDTTNNNIKGCEATIMNARISCAGSDCYAECLNQYRFIDGRKILDLSCVNSEWREKNTGSNILPKCEAICEPSCLNNGICVTPNLCQCPENYQGDHCQHYSKPCLNFPTSVMNAHQQCSDNVCKIQCLDGRKFPDGSSITQLNCQNGVWVPSKTGWSKIPDCQYDSCTPACQNGGTCWPASNVCSCPSGYYGFRCENQADSSQNPFRGPVQVYNLSYIPPGFNFTHPGFGLPTNSFYNFSHNMQPIEWNQSWNYSVPGQDVISGQYQHEYNKYGHMVTPSSPDIPVDVVPQVPPDYPQVHQVPVMPQIMYTESPPMIFQPIVPKRGTCFTWSGTHYKTFDGKVFSFDSKCSHTLVKDAIDNTFMVGIQNSPKCLTHPESCYRVITIYYQGKNYFLQRSDEGYPVFSTVNKVLPLPGQQPGLRAEMSAHYVVISLDSVGLIIRWDGELLLQIEALEGLWQRTDGLCGTLDGNPENDMLVEGFAPHNIATLASNWKIISINEMCDEEPNDQHVCQDYEMVGSPSYKAKVFCDKLLNDPRFAPCHFVMDVSLLFDACTWDYCSCKKSDPSECACETMNVYVKECKHKGINAITKWRDDNTCPLHCTGGRIYMPCGPANGQPVCGALTQKQEEDGACVEGCYCPEGTVLHKNKCITIDECPCRHRGKPYQPGAMIPKLCNTCTCKNGLWDCTDEFCGARCAAIGDPHYTTFDGKRYDFMGHCSYYLVKGADFSIEAENVACAGSISQAMNFPVSISAGLPSCTKTVTIKIADHVIKLKQNHEVIINGEELTKIPYKESDISIRSISSIFLLVLLPNGVEVWWDGQTRAYIDAPKELRGKTKGLCGTFNSNQNDDFLTPDDDIEESVIAFANKWKTSEACSDIPDKLISNPCDTNMQNLGTAEEHCNILKSNLFEECHLSVEPEKFYQDCLYDMCSCQSKVAKCLCPILATYAEECSNHNVKIDWRNEVTECGIHCTGGQKYQVCGNPCTRSCSDIAMIDNCTAECVEGCNCPEGQALDEEGECIPIKQCQCFQEGLYFDPGYKEIKMTDIGSDLCTCLSGKWICRPASADEVNKYPKIEALMAYCDPSANMEFTTCESVEPKTCKNMHSYEHTSPAICHSGCQCKEGYVLDTTTKKCVRPNECPCHHGGKSYPENSQVKHDCNTCKCTYGKWRCTHNECPSQCSAWGDSHFKTFDGKHYDFQGQCDYVLAKGKIPEGSFEISTQNVPCGTLGTSCSKAITIRIDSGSEQETYTLTRGKRIPEYETLSHLSLRQKGLFVIVEALDLGLTVRWDKGTRVYVKLDPRWKNKVQGLCGNYNGNYADDFQTPSGGINEASAQIFGDSWRLQPYCPNAIEVFDTCQARPDRKVWALKKCGILKSPLFAPCHAEVSLENYFDKCVFDTCACDQGGDCECLCTAIAAYAQECNEKGVHIKWRSQDICPMQCDETCSNYNPCVSPCTIETCDNTLTLSKLSKSCSEDSCIEACQPKPCPSGHIYLNSSYTECVPKDICKPICMTYNGKQLFEGDVVDEDECHKCHCSRGKKICKGQPCATTPQPVLVTQPTLPKIISCVSGWTEWISQDEPPKEAKAQKRRSEIEPIPSPLVMKNLVGSKCDTDKIVNIECRTTHKHTPFNETNFDVTCDIQNGLYCKTNKRRGCPDFEIRVECKCDKYAICDVDHPNEQHPTDCSMFYHCDKNVDGSLMKVEKTCGKDMYYNPETMVCDWPYEVVKIRPECQNDTDYETAVGSMSVIPGISKQGNGSSSGKMCPPGQIYSDCALDCNQMCLYYSHIMVQSGTCKTDNFCVAGCVDEINRSGCPPGMLWVNNNTCVAIHDCLCRSNTGEAIRPGAVVQEDKCMTCQCIDNHYSCTDTCIHVKKKIHIDSSFRDYQKPQTEPSSGSPGIEGYTTPYYVTPPKKCDEKNYINLIQGDEPLPDSAFSASSTLGPSYAPENARISSKVSFTSSGSWSPKVYNTDQYLQINLGRQQPVYGVIIKGSPIFDDYVTSYKVIYSPDGHSYYYVLNEDNYPQIFRGSVENNTPVKTIFAVPFEAKVIRINPQTWNGAISLQVELIGCGVELTTLNTELPGEIYVVATTPHAEICTDEMGLDNGKMSDSQIQVSSEFIPANKKNLKLSSTEAWQPLMNSPAEYVQFNFLEPRIITGIKTEGGPNGWVTQFLVKYSTNGIDWNTITDKQKNEKFFAGNFDSYSEQLNMFDMSINAKYVRIIPKKWHKNIQLKTEIIGCFEPYPVFETSTEKLADRPVATDCFTCQGIPKPEHTIDCPCKPPMYWDGENCVKKTQCPCIVGHFKYEVGAVFEKEDCSECVCKLGGQDHCMPKICGKCAEGLRSTVTSTCACTCKPCPKDTVLCPTSNICINATQWCDGVQDCPDDEVSCHEPETSQPPIITTTPEPEERCPLVSCGPGYEQIEVNVKQSKALQYHINLLPMYKATNTKKSNLWNYEGANPRKGYTKGKDTRMTLEKPTSAPKKEETIIEECPVFVCKAKKPQIAWKNNPSECPPGSCPPGLVIQYKEIDYISKKCPAFDCSPPPPPDAVCNVTGRTFNTFDGVEYKYDICDHLLVRDIENDEWQISLKKNCTTVCTRDLIIRHEDHTFVLHPDLSLDFDGYPYNMEHVKKIGSQFKAFQMTLLGKTLLFVSNRFGFWVLWDERGDVKVGVIHKMVEQVDGLCGYFNDNPHDDKRKPDGREAQSTVEFGDSWTHIEQAANCEPIVCPQKIQDKAWRICNEVKDQRLAACSRVLDIDAFISRCGESMCECLEETPGNKSAEDNCRCEAIQTFVVSCMAADPSIQLPDWRLNLDCPATCEPPFVYQDCYQRKCEATCDTVADPTMCPKLANLCFPGCYCPPGTVRKGDTCMKPSDCRDCECNVLPHLQYVTYDESNFTVTGNCVYVMSRDLLMNMYDEHKFQVLITNHPCQENPDKMCVGKITILYNGHKIHVLLDRQHGSLRMIIDGEWVEDVTELSGWISVRQTPARHFKILLIDVQVEVSVYYPSLGVSIKAPSQKYGGKLEGLCGDCNKNPKDDMRIHDGDLTDDEEEFALSWLYEHLPGGQSPEQCGNKVTDTCVELPKDSNPCTQLLDVNKFGHCHPVLDPSLFIEWCQKDVCSGTPEQSCTAIEAYARECGRFGFCINWRTSICPAKSCPPGLHFDPCGTSCPKTCESIKGKQKKCKIVPAEGCFCPEGKVLSNNTCVVEKDCVVCDAEGHHPGDVWKKDKCTTCRCEGTSLKCDQIQCSSSNTVCEKGYQSVTIPAGDDECCDKYTCIPEPSTGPTCEPPTKLVCGPGQILKLDTKANGCQQFICECKPLSECEQPDFTTDKPLEDGYEKVLDNSGCCPVSKLICKPELCPPPQICPQYHSVKNETIQGKCCPIYTCEPPTDKCIFDTEFTESEKGGERPRSKYEIQQLLKNPGEVWNDGPCRECKCSQDSNGKYQSVCNRKDCQTIETSPDFASYILQQEPIIGECCAKLKRVACRVGMTKYDVGEKWTIGDDYCAMFECVQTTTGEITKQTQVTTCDTNCGLGSEYVPPSPKSQQCCGTCQPTACVVDGKLYKPGDKWLSPDHCTQYECSIDKENLQVRSVVFSCPEIPADLLENYVFESKKEANKCCNTNIMVACKHHDKIYKEGETWYDEKNKCRQFTCDRDRNGKLVKRESTETCIKDCAMGWEYAESNTTCCGKCIPIGCVVDDQVKLPNETWAVDEKGCALATCELFVDQYVVVVAQETCPKIDDCLEENIIDTGCCKICNMTSVSQTRCVAEAMKPEKTVEILKVQHEAHGWCTNKQPVVNFNECVGNCHSATMFNKKMGRHDSVCTCCRSLKTKPINVMLECEDGQTLNKKVFVPIRCGCEGCAANVKSVKTG